MRTKITISALILIIFFGIFLRLYGLSQAAYWMDEGFTVNAVLSTIKNGTLDGSALLDSGKTYYCPLYCSSSAVLTKIIGENALAYRMISVVCGVLVILLIFFLSKKLFKKNSIALLTAFFMSFSYWQIAWSRQARWYTMFELFFWACLFFFYYFLSKRSTVKRTISLIVSLSFCILSIATHSLGYLLPLILFLSYLYYERPNIKKIFASIIITVSLIAFVEFGLGLHIIADLIQKISWHYTLPYYLNFYLRHYWLFIALAVYGFFGAKREQKRSITLLCIPLLIYLLLISFFTDIVHYRYLFHLTPIFFLTGSFAISEMIDKVRPLFYKNFLLIVVLFIFIATGAGIIFPRSFYLLEADDPTKLDRPYYAYTPQPDWNKAYGYIKQNKGTDEIIISSQPQFNKIFLKEPGYWIYYDYLSADNNATPVYGDKESYVGAQVIRNVDELSSLINSKHGFIVLDFMAMDNRISQDIISIIKYKCKLVFEDKINDYSQVWVYKF